MKKWFIKFPTFQYQEDVKALAKKHSLKIIDMKFQGSESQCENAPALTLKSKKQIIAERGLSSEEANVILNSLTTKTPADDVKSLAKFAGIEYTTSQDTIAAIKTKYGRK